MHGQNREDGFDTPCSAQQMPDGSFGATDIDLGRFGFTAFPKKEVFDRAILGCIAKYCASRMRVDVVDKAGL
jgi:hypothetical protein